MTLGKKKAFSFFTPLFIDVFYVAQYIDSEPIEGLPIKVEV